MGTVIVDLLTRIWAAQQVHSTSSADSGFSSYGNRTCFHSVYTREIIFESAHFAGGGSNMTIAGTKAIADDAVEDLSIDGRVNLALANLVLKDTDAFFGGFANVSLRYTGPKNAARLGGTADIENGSVAAFIGPDRISFDRIKGRLIFTANQAADRRSDWFSRRRKIYR